MENDKKNILKKFKNYKIYLAKKYLWSDKLIFIQDLFIKITMNLLIYRIWIILFLS